MDAGRARGAGAFPCAALEPLRILRVSAARQRRVGAVLATACFAACAYAFSVGETVNLYYSSGTVMSMLTASLYALLYAMDVASRRGVVLVALVIAALMAGGHPESVLHIAMGASLLLVVELA